MNCRRDGDLCCMPTDSDSSGKFPPGETPRSWEGRVVGADKGRAGRAPRTWDRPGHAPAHCAGAGIRAGRVALLETERLFTGNLAP